MIIRHGILALLAKIFWNWDLTKGVGALRFEELGAQKLRDEEIPPLSDRDTLPPTKPRGHPHFGFGFPSRRKESLRTPCVELKLDVPKSFASTNP